MVGAFRALVGTALAYASATCASSDTTHLQSRGATLPPVVPALDSDAFDVDLLAWASASPSTAKPMGPPPRAPQLLNATRLLIGVKSASLDGFQNRQTIRQTWANAAVRPHGVMVVFLGCEPEWTTRTNATEWRRALEREKTRYGDLLTDELACQDSYWTLVEKVQGFLQWTTDAARRGSSLAYVMLADDDVYVDLQRLTVLLFQSGPPVVPRRRVYGGQVLQTQFGTVIRPLRDPIERNFLSVETYPMHVKPHFATGAHYLLSIDLVRILARNRDALRGVGTLEDVSVAFWLRALLGVRPVHMWQFDNVRYKLCHNGLIAYADLSPVAMRRIHQNLRENRRFCDGFSAPSWDKRGSARDRLAHLPQSNLLTKGDRRLRPLQYHWDVQVDVRTRVFNLVTTLSTKDDGTSETAMAVYAPAKDSLVVFCHALLVEAQIYMTTTAIPLDFCLEYRELLSRFLTSVASAAPATSPMYALAHKNLLEDSLSSAVFVELTSFTFSSRTLIECLVAAALTGVHVSVLETVDYAARFSPITPDIVFTTTADSLDKRAARVVAFRDLDDRFPSATSSFCGFAIEISSIQMAPHCRHAHHIYIPMASQSFAHRQAHSPVALLEASSRTETEHHGIVLLSCRTRYAVASAAADVISRHLHDEGFAADTESCEKKKGGATLDDDVARFSKYTFIVVVEDRVDVAGHVTDHIVSAFLAGAIPVYYGHAATVAWLFNPRAFIDCGAFASLRECTRYVSHVAETPTAYAAMKKAPPVVNKAAFVEIFSWHPHVIEMAEQDGLEPYLIGHRLNTLINNS